MAAMMDFRYWLRGFSPSRLSRWLPLVIVLLAALLRFHMIATQSLWNDEGNTLRLIERPINDLLLNASHDIHPPGYYLALKGWWSLTGDSEFALRAFSALAGMLTAACVFALGRSLFATGVGLLASLLVAVNAFSVYYGQEARMYALLALLAAASLLVFVRWTARPSWRLALLLALLNAAGLYTQYVYPFVMITQGLLFILWWGGKRDRRWLLMYVALNLLTLVLFLPQLGTALAQIAQWPRTGLAVSPGEWLATVGRWLVYGNTASGLDWSAYIWPVIFVLAALLPDWKRLAQPSWWRRLVPWVWLVVTVLPMVILGLFRDANLKFLLPGQIALALLMARGAWLLWEIGSANIVVLLEALPRLLAGAGILSMAGFYLGALNNLYKDPAYARSDYRAMAQVISTNARPGDAIILDAPNQSEVFTYYYHGTDPIYSLPVGLGGDDPATAGEVDKVISTSRRIFVLYWGEDERDPNKIVEKTLLNRAFEVNSVWYGDVRLVRYASSPDTNSTPIAVTGTPTQFGTTITLRSATLSGAAFPPGDVLGITLTWSASEPIPRRYKVFIHLLDSNGNLVSQRDSEPGDNLAITTTWQPGDPVIDRHGLLIPLDLPAGSYSLIMGLYDLDNPESRLPVGTADHVSLGNITVTP